MKRFQEALKPHTLAEGDLVKPVRQLVRQQCNPSKPGSADEDPPATQTPEAAAQARAWTCTVTLSLTVVADLQAGAVVSAQGPQRRPK